MMGSSSLPQSAPSPVSHQRLAAAHHHKSLLCSTERDTETIAAGDEAKLAPGVAAHTREQHDVGLAALCRVDREDAEVFLLEDAV